MHGVPFAPVPIVRDALPLLGAWYAASALTRLYRSPRWSAFLLSWGMAVPIGILIRQLWVGRLLTRATPIFLLVALGLTLVFLTAGRVLIWSLVRLAGRRTHPSVDRPGAR